ncbi:MAG: anthranilate synthase component I [Chloroflexota bacterium]
MYKPTLSEVEELANQGNMIPIYRELPADLDTPVSIYLKLRDEGASFLLESITGGEHVSRYSFIGVRPRALVTAIGEEVFIDSLGYGKTVPISSEHDPLAFLKAEMADITPVEVPGLPRFSGGAIGMLAYDAVRRFENLPDDTQDDLKIPEAAFMLADTLVAYDHAWQRILVIANAKVDEGDLRIAYQQAIARIDEVVARLSAPIVDTSVVANSDDYPDDFVSNVSQAEYEDRVERAKEYIRAGDIFQVVPSQRLSKRTPAHPFAIYRHLRRVNPSPYMVFMRFPGGIGNPPLHIIAGSPEMHVRLENRTAELRPIAGTRWRGKTIEEDNALAEELLADEKERAEHVMLVDLGRNDLGRVCEYGSVYVEEMMIVERYSHVMHIVSDVRGKLQDQYDAFDLIRATFPAGTVSGAPKVRAMEIIEELESSKRGLYAGILGYVGYEGNMDTCIALRTMVMRGDTVHLQAGGGVVADSDPTYEYNESINKARALSVAVKLAEAELEQKQ